MDRIRRRKLVILATVVLLAAASAVISRVVVAQPGDDSPGGLGGSSRPPRVVPSAAPVPGGPGFYAQSALLFRPYSPDYDYAYLSADLYNPGSFTGYYEGALSLPNGVTVTKFVAYYWDNDVAFNLRARLYRCGLGGSGVELMAAVDSLGNSTAYRYVETASILEPVIDQQSYAYAVEVQLPADIDVRFVGVRIDYAHQISLPLATKE